MYSIISCFLFFAVSFVSPQLQIQIQASSQSFPLLNSESKLNPLFDPINYKIEEKSFFTTDCSSKPVFSIGPKTNAVSLFFENVNESKKNMEISLNVKKENDTQIKILNIQSLTNQKFVLEKNKTVDVEFDCLKTGKYDSTINFFLEIDGDDKNDKNKNEKNEKEKNNISFSFQKLCTLPSRSPESLLFLMTAAVLVVAFAAQLPPLNLGEEEELQQMQGKHAILFIVFGSLMLMALFYFLKQLQFLLTCAITFSSFTGVTMLSQEVILKWLPYSRKIIGRIPLIGVVNYGEIIGCIIGFFIVGGYLLTRNWILNNIIGISLVILIIRSIRVPTLPPLFLLLSLSFFYDIFWVFISPYIFGTSVMSYVALNLNLPIKLICPSPPSCSLLGLGDMALPGFLICWAQQQDQKKMRDEILNTHSERRTKGNKPIGKQANDNEEGQRERIDRARADEQVHNYEGIEIQNESAVRNIANNSQDSIRRLGADQTKSQLSHKTGYFATSMICYGTALLLCLCALMIFKTGQPALLYISPLLISGITWRACTRGEMREIWEGRKRKREGLGRDERLEGEKDGFYRDNTLIEVEKGDGI